MMADKTAHRFSYQFSFAAGSIVFYTWPWLNALLYRWGYRPYRSAGIWIGLGLMLVFLGLAVGTDYLLYRLGLPRRVRSGLWLAATLGPLAGFAVFNTWGYIVAGQVAAILAIMLGFVLGYSSSRSDYMEETT